ncbi:MAG: Ig-like domain-containing protein [Propionibacteriaceae bacterium]|nr:Ig-like domain-containing protein [Propionibacteriaceae bacterium]
MAGPAPTAHASSIGGPIATSEILSRAQDWVNRGIPYSMNASATDAEGAHTYRTDCSGFVSMAWHAAKSYVTGPETPNLPSVSNAVSYDNLQPGDALIKQGVGAAGHARLFASWSGSGKTAMYVYELSGGTTAAYRYYSRSSLEGSYQAWRYIYAVNDMPAPTVGTVTIAGTQSVGSTLTAQASVSPASATVTYQWYRDGWQLAERTAKTYAVTADDAGKQLKVTVTAKANGQTASNSASVTIPSGVLPSYVKVSGPDATLVVGGTARLTGTVYPANATNNTLSWRVTDTSIATVSPVTTFTNSATVTLTGKKTGTTKVWAETVNGFSTYVTITVKAAETTKPDVTLYWDTKQGGASLPLSGDGCRNLEGNWDNQTTTLVVANTAKQVRLYQNKGCSGPYLAVPAGTHDLWDFGFNDQTSSVQILNDPTPYGVVWYNDVNGDLSSNVRTTESATPANVPSMPTGWNDQVSFLYVPYCSKVTIYEHVNYGGASLPLTSGIYNLPTYTLRQGVNWNDQLSSYKVVKDTSKAGC